MAVRPVRVEGLRELNRDLGIANRKAQKELQKELRIVAEPVAFDARSRAERYGPNTSEKIRAGSSRGNAIVRQRARRTTGKRPDFGRLQMRKVLLPALYENIAVVERGVEEMLDKLFRGTGWH